MKQSARNSKGYWIAAFVVFVLGAISTASWLGRNPSLPSAHPSQARIHFLPDSDDSQGDLEGESRAVRDFETSDSAAIFKLVSAMQEAQACGDHKCGALGTIQLSYPSGDFSFGFFPGHTEGFYEVRSQDGIYRLPYDSFVEALVACGVPRKSIP